MTTRFCPSTKRAAIASTAHSAMAAFTIAMSCSDQSVSGNTDVQTRATQPINGGCFG